MGDVQKRVGGNVARLRKQRGLTQEALAQAADVKQTYLSEIENGKRNPTLGMLVRLATALDADVHDLTRP
jgi:transcriptional regulator with XRE-family HTH domain